MKNPKLIKAMKKKLDNIQEETKESQEEHLTREKIFGQDINPFTVFEAETLLREHCKEMIDPILKHQVEVILL